MRPSSQSTSCIATGSDRASAMTPIFNADVRLVGFFDGTYLFDLDNDWVAFHDRGNLFGRGGRWLGPLKDGTFQDHDGRAVAWLAGSRPATGMTRRSVTVGVDERPMEVSRRLLERRRHQVAMVEW